jgi:hypothetical protein
MPALFLRRGVALNPALFLLAIQKLIGEEDISISDIRRGAALNPAGFFKSLTKTLAVKNRRFFTYKSFWRYLFNESGIDEGVSVSIGRYSANL